MSNTLQDKISIIMPCYNAAEHLEHTLSSALGQSYRNIELIVADDGSTDRSLAILEERKQRDDRLIVIRQKNTGPGPARNRGLAEASGEYIAFLDSDDFWVDDCLEKLHNALVNSSAAIAYCGWQNIGLKDGQGEPYIPPDYSDENKFITFLSGCRWPIHAALTRHSAIQSVGGFNERWTSCMDYDLWLRLATQFDIVLVPEVLAFYRHHEGVQITKNKARGAINHWLVQQDFLEHHPDIVQQIGARVIRKLTHGELLRRGYVAYWARNLEAAHTIFRKVMKSGYGGLKDWKYMLPALLPLNIYRKLLNIIDTGKQKA